MHGTPTPSPPPTVLWLGPAGKAETALIRRLRARGLTVTRARDLEAALAELERARCDALVLPLPLPRVEGPALVRRLRARHPELGVVFLGPRSAVRDAPGLLREGAWDVLASPVDADRLLVVLERGLAHRRLAARLAELEGAMTDLSAVDFDGRSPAITRVMEQIRHVASTHAAVLIEGEEGTGKARAARAIHRHSPRRGRPFVALDLAAMDGEVVERELFGVDGAAQPRPGRIERADGGTLFLGRIDAAPAGVQVRLLRLLQDRSFERVGGRTPLKVDVRTIAATPRDLTDRVEAGRFRGDLLQRLGAVRVVIPALRERREDIPWLADRFARDSSRRHRRRLRGMTRGVVERLQRHPWPGNVRELREVVDGMVASASGARPLDLDDLPAPLRGGRGEPAAIEIAPGTRVEDAVRRLIVATLEHVGHDKPRAAAMLGIGLRTLYRKIREYGLR